MATPSDTDLESPPPLPAWLIEDGHDTDVVVSSRARVMRNLAGHRFPHVCPPEEALLVAEAIVWAGRLVGLRPVASDLPEGSDLLLGSRLVSPDFQANAPGRAILTDADRRVAVMVNEEDHLRAQCLTSGFTPRQALASALCVTADLGTHLDWATHPRYGHLAASPYNCGEGTRVSALFHLIGLAQTGRLGAVLRACSEEGIVARGLFGERSRAVGAFFQLSHLGSDRQGFEAAGRYLLAQEREARSEKRAIVPVKEFEVRAFLMDTHLLSLSDALRSLGWLRWAACEGHFAVRAKDVDLWATHLLSGSDPKDRAAGRKRASFLRARLS